MAPFEIKELRQVALGTIVRFKYEVYDLHGSALTLSAVTYRVRDASGNLVFAGTGTVNNNDADAAGNTIKTVLLPVDFSETDYAKGHYQMTFTVTLSSTETEKFKVPLELIDYEEVS